MASRAFNALPWKNYREVGGWLEEFIDALGDDFDIWWSRFIGGKFETETRSGRLKLTDVDYVVSEVASASLATATAPPTAAKSQDTMLDMLLYAAGVPWPVDGNWTIAQRREFVRVGGDVLQSKGTRRAILKMMAGAMSGVIQGVNLPPWQTSIVHGDGSPSPGYISGAVPVKLLAGTVATTITDATVTGTGTAFVTDGSWNGLIILIDNLEYWISSVTSATELELTAAAVSSISGKTARVVFAVSSRPWLFEATSNVLRRVFPSWALQGVGYSQFRAGFSAAGEPALATGARINILLNEHFSDFTGAAPTSWTSTGAATLTRSTFNASPQPEINHEFTSYCAQLDLTAAASTVSAYLNQSTAAVNNQSPHRFELDYSYTNAQLVGVLTTTITDIDNDQTYYWPGAATVQSGTVDLVEGSKTVTGTGTTFVTSGLWVGMPLLTSNGKTHIIESVESTTSLTVRDVALMDENDATFSVTCWTSVATSITIPVGAAAATRVRYACDVYPQRASATSALRGTQRINVKTGAVSDGTATTQVVYTLYRHGLYEKHDPTIEAEATGERTLWLPLRDALGWAVIGGGSTDDFIENANASRSALKLITSTGPAFDYHPALSRRGFRSTAAWTNILLGTKDILAAQWATASGATTAAATDISPVCGESVATATRLTHTAVADYFGQTTGTTPTSKSYLAGIWVKRNTVEPGYQAGTITVTSGSATVTGSGTAFAASWVGSDIKTAAGYVYKVTAVGGATSLTIAAVAGRTESAVQFKVSDVCVQLISTTTKSVGFFVTQAEGWKLLPLNSQTFDGAELAALQMRLRFPSQASETWGLYAPYLFDVTSKTDVLYPPIAIDAGASTGVYAATYCDALTDTVGTDVNSELLKSAVASVSRGSLDLTVVPTFGAGSQPTSTILDLCETAAANRLHLHIDTGVLKVTRFNNAGTNSALSLTLTTSDEPTSSQVTWKRDTAIRIRVRWDDDGKTSLSAGSSNATGTLAVAPYTDTLVDTLRLGATAAAASNFDGIITDVEFVQVGTPVN